LVGILIASIGSGFAQPYLVAGIGVSLIIIFSTFYLLFSKRLKVIFLLPIVFLGAAYFFIYDWRNQPDPLSFGRKQTIYGIIVGAEQRLETQKIILQIHGQDALVQIATQRYPEFAYGDLVEVIGAIQPIEGEWADYFMKEGIAGLMGFPKINLISKNNGSSVKAGLLRIKSFFVASYKKIFTFEQATFLSGLTLGETAEFGDEFKEKLRATGTSHLVALSGYNITMIIQLIFSALGGWWLTKKFSFSISTFLVVAFVVMTGAEASVVRAAIMAFILLLAERIGRLDYVRNSMAAAALAMVVYNPRVLVFDIGFQLSFAALIGIVYLKPWLERLPVLRGKAGFGKWRENLRTTTAAQIAVLPLLLYHFSYFSPIGLITNVLILPAVPYAMMMGFALAPAAALFQPLAWLFGLPVNFILSYILWIIDLFSKISL